MDLQLLNPFRGEFCEYIAPNGTQFDHKLHFYVLRPEEVSLDNIVEVYEDTYLEGVNIDPEEYKLIGIERFRDRPLDEMEQIEDFLFINISTGEIEFAQDLCEPQTIASSLEMFVSGLNIVK